MNRTYLMQHVSRHLHTLVRCYSAAWEPLEVFCARADLQDDGMESILQTWFSGKESRGEISIHIPVFLCLGNHAVYTRIPAGEILFLLGPVSFSIPVEFHWQEPLSLPEPTFLDRVPVCDFHEFMSDVLLIANLFTARCIREETILQENCVDPQIRQNLVRKHMKHTFENRENKKLHNPYEQELREFSGIEKGNLKELESSLREDYPGEIGCLSPNPLRHMKNRGIVVITLASRAAIRGGILPEEAFSLADSYIQEIENCNDVPTVIHLFHSAEYHYAQLVHDHEEKAPTDKLSNLYTEKCKTYIFSHLHGRIRVRDIAGELNISANYLSEIFHRYEGVTITEYIHREKVKLTQNLLTYSEYTYSEIAAYLGYSSQSHLGRQFRKHTGMTMYQYRTRYGRH